MESTLLLFLLFGCVWFLHQDCGCDSFIIMNSPTIAISIATTTTTTTTNNLAEMRLRSAGGAAVAVAAGSNLINNDNDDNCDDYSFRGNVADLPLPEPPLDIKPLYYTKMTTTIPTSGSCTDTPGSTTTTTTNTDSIVWKVPTRFNYVTSTTTKIIIQRDIDGKDSIGGSTENTNSSGMGDFTNHRTIWVENGRHGVSKTTVAAAASSSSTAAASASVFPTQPFTLHRNGFELIQTFSIPSLSFHQPKMTATTANTIDFKNRNDVLDYYYPSCERLVQEVLLMKENEAKGIIQQQQQQQATSGNDSSSTNHKNHISVWAFDHNVRCQESHQQQPEEVQQEEPSASTTSTNTNTNTTTVVQKPIGLVHGDYTITSAPRRLELLGQVPKVNDIYYHRLRNGNSHHDSEPQELPTLLDPNIVQECLYKNRRYAFINVWRNIDTVHPVLSVPLGCVDATTTQSKQQFHELPILEVQYIDRVGENYLACAPSSSSSSSEQSQQQHRWVYFPQMNHNEALLIKQWDSAGTDITIDRSNCNKQSTPTPQHQNNNSDNDAEYVSTFALHSAFIDPTTPLNAPSRQSIEVRCVAIWENTV